jgi:HEAT repeat protein
LIEALDDPADPIREAVFIAFGKIGASAKEAVPALINGLNEPSIMLRFRAAEALVRILPNAREEIPPLSEVLKECDREIRIFTPDGQACAAWRPAREMTE